MHFGPYLVTCAIKAPIQFYLLVATAEKGGASQRILTVIETVYGGVRLQSSVLWTRQSGTATTQYITLQYRDKDPV